MAIMRSLEALSAVALLLPYVGAQGGEFTLSCAPLTTQRSDPIVFPGQPGGHTHAIIGGTAFSRSMSNDAAPNAKLTTCSIAMDRSNYWQPQLYHIRSDGQFEIVEWQGTAAYYLQRACDYAPDRTECDLSVYPKAPPAGLRMVSGNPFLRSYNDTLEMRAVSHMCLVNEGETGGYSQALPTQPCARLRSQTFFPSCWDGVNLDSSDHQSHMAFPAIGDYNTGVCPESHPVAIISIFLEYFYNTSPFPDWENLVYAMGDLTGYGLHGDFVNGWEDLDALAKAFETCSAPNSVDSPTCSITQGNVIPAEPHDLEHPAPEENLGLEGPIPALPGDNPVTGSADDRVN